MQQQAAAREVELKLTEMRISLSATEERCQKLSGELADAREREIALTATARSEQSRVEQLLVEHSNAVTMFKQEAQAKLSAVQAEHAAAEAALRNEHVYANRNTNTEQDIAELRRKVDKWKGKAKDLDRKRRHAVQKADDENQALQNARVECENTVRKTREQCTVEISAAQSATREAEQALSDAAKASDRALIDLRAEISRAEHATSTAIAESESSSTKHQEAVSELAEVKRERNALAKERDVVQQDLRDATRQVEQLCRDADMHKVAAQLQVSQYDQKLAETVHATELQLRAEHSSFLAQTTEQHQRELQKEAQQVRKLQAQEHALQCELMTTQHKYEEEAHVAATAKQTLESTVPTLKTQLAQSEEQRTKLAGVNEENRQAILSLNAQVSLLEADKAELAQECERIEQELSVALQEQAVIADSEIEEARLATENLETSLRDLQTEMDAATAHHQRETEELVAKNSEQQHTIDEQRQGHARELQQLKSGHDTAQQSHGMAMAQLNQRCEELVVLRQKQAREFDDQRSSMITKLGQVAQDNNALTNQLGAANDKTRQLMSEMDNRNDEFQHEVKLLTDSVATAQAEMEQTIAREVRQHERQMTELRELGDEQLRDAKRDYTRRLNEASA
eukprot:COSAG06_NODE_9487_length_1888_cov_4.216322_1_plen_628_part_11